MAGRGFGWGYGGPQRNAPPILGGPPREIQSVQPAAAWDGTAASGFSTVPQDPPRTTAKPVCRLIVVPNQFYTDELLVGVYAAASFNRSMINNLGLKKVVFHYEGGKAEALFPSVETVMDANGNPQQYLGWWARLKHDGKHGRAQLYVEAVPQNANMQARVIGPVDFFPNVVRHDAEYTIEPSQPEIAGQRYKAFNFVLLKHIRDNGFRNPRITFREPGTYTMGPWSPYTPDGHLTLEAEVPITFANAPGSYGTFRTKLDGMWFRGGNITLDMADAAEIYHEGSARQHVFDGCRITNSRGRWATWEDGRLRPVSFIARGNPIFLEAEIDNLPNPCRNARMARGTVIRDTYADVFSDCPCVIGTRTHSVDQSLFYDGIPALEVRFDGTGGTATIEASGSSLSKTFTLKRDGAAVSSFTTSASTLAWNGGSGGAYFTRDVAAWINAQDGWSASVLDETLCGTYLGETNGRGRAFGPIDCLGSPAVLEAAVDIHSDWHQIIAPIENVVIANNVAYDMTTQGMLWGFPVRDALVVNTILHNTAFDPSWQSQFSSSFSHVSIMHCNWPTQQVTLRSSFSADGYSTFTMNTSHALVAETGLNGLAVLRHLLHDNHSPPSGAQDTIIGGDVTTNYRDAQAGDFMPDGTLRASNTTGAFLYDLRHFVRTPFSGRGAITMPYH